MNLKIKLGCLVRPLHYFEMGVGKLIRKKLCEKLNVESIEPEQYNDLINRYLTTKEYNDILSEAINPDENGNRSYLFSTFKFKLVGEFKYNKVPIEVDDALAEKILFRNFEWKVW